MKIHKLNVGSDRPSVCGRFLFLGTEKFFVKGVTYGTFRPTDEGDQFPPQETVERDFASMRANGINTVRTYTVPPAWLLDTARRNGLFVMVGLPWEQHFEFLNDRRRAASIQRRIRDAVRTCASHPAVLCYAIGNEIPASITRWLGKERVERFLHRLYLTVKEEDGAALVTYVNFPTTEYLQLPFLDFVCFNVYLESDASLTAYLARLHNLAGDKPLVMAEVGLDSLRHGEHVQANTLASQIRTVFRSGCAGAFVFAWTDEWYRGGSDIEDWDFGITRRDRSPKPALLAVRQAFSQAPMGREKSSPKISIVVCSHNGSRTIGETLDAVRKLAYPNYETIVVDDGCTDDTFQIASRFALRVVRTGQNVGLSAARNAGMYAATGEIVAYLDDDSYPDTHWLDYLASAFQDSTHSCIGGPNLPVPGDGSIADCVANSPGGPNHVLLSDLLAEHVPGCNMAFLRERLVAIGGFDPQFRAAGDDVDVCWRVQEQGWTVGFCAAAVVWHHRRNSLRTYWRQQKGYGKAEALLARKWPERYNAAGHLTWEGRLYGKGFTRTLLKQHIYHGTWCTAPFQRIYEYAPSFVASLPLIPEWYILNALLSLLAVLGLTWSPLLLAFPLLAISSGLPLIFAFRSAAYASFTTKPVPGLRHLHLRALVTILHAVQPAARLWGRLSHGLTPWRSVRLDHLCSPLPKKAEIWSETWRPHEHYIQRLESLLKSRRHIVRRGGDFDPWDLELGAGVFGRVRCKTGVEEHGAGRQLVRFWVFPAPFPVTVMTTVILGVLSIWAAADGGAAAALIMAAQSVLLMIAAILEAASGLRSVCDVLPLVGDDGASGPYSRESTRRITDRDQRSSFHSAPGMAPVRCSAGVGWFWIGYGWGVWREQSGCGSPGEAQAEGSEEPDGREAV